MEKLFEELGINKDQYFLTGSTALDNEELDYQISTRDSDYDYVLSIKVRHLITNWLVDNKINVEYSCYNGGFKFSLDGKLYNIITCIDIEFQAWKDSLEILKYFIKTGCLYQNALKDKRIRYSVYEQLRGLCKSTMTIGEIINAR